MDQILLKNEKVDVGRKSHLMGKCCDVNGLGESKMQFKWNTRGYKNALAHVEMKKGEMTRAESQLIRKQPENDSRIHWR